MDSFNSNIASLVPGMIIRFGSLDFIAGNDGKLGVASQETPSPGQIGSGPADNLPIGHGDAFAAIPRDDLPIGHGDAFAAIPWDSAIHSEHGSLSPPGSATARSG